MVETPDISVYDSFEKTLGYYNAECCTGVVVSNFLTRLIIFILDSHIRTLVQAKRETNASTRAFTQPQ